MRLILVRHAETSANAEGLLQGLLNTELSDKGKEQCKLLAERFKEEPIDVIYTSDLSRAVATAKAIAKHHDVQVKVSKDLRDRSLGVYQGRTKEETDWQTLRKKFYTVGWHPPGGGESLEDVYGRLDSFLQRLRRDHSKETVLAIVHGPMGRLLMCSLLGKDPTDARDMDKLDNASISMFEVNGLRAKMLVFNDTGHLDGNASDEK